MSLFGSKPSVEGARPGVGDEQEKSTNPYPACCLTTATQHIQGNNLRLSIHCKRHKTDFLKQKIIRHIEIVRGKWTRLCGWRNAMDDVETVAQEDSPQTGEESSLFSQRPRPVWEFMCSAASMVMWLRGTVPLSPLLLSKTSSPHQLPNHTFSSINNQWFNAGVP